MKNIFQIGKAWDYIAHRRMIAFWSVMAIMLLLPWIMPACTSPMKNQVHYDNCRVLSVYDGDTMTVNCQGEKIKVRLYCIDAPEMGQEPWGREARDFLRAITGSLVRVAVRGTDRYGRVVGEMSAGDRELNLVMVQAGKALVYDRYCEDPRYPITESGAREQKKGVWATPGPHQAPWAWRSQ